MDRSTQGSPAKFTYCFGENEELSPWDPYHVRHGFTAKDSVATVMAAEAPQQPYLTLPQSREFPPDAVTALGLSGTLEVLPSGKDDTLEAILTPVARVMPSAYKVSGASRNAQPGDQVVLLPPELAELIRNREWELARIQEFLFEAST